MELRHLRYFVAVAEELHFGRAAKRLHISQPPLSQQIKHLEEEVEAALLIRTHGQVRLTDAGRELLQRAKAIIADTEEAVKATKRSGSGEQGNLKIGYMGFAAIEMLPRSLAKFKKRYPAVETFPMRMMCPDQAAALRERRIDVGFLCPPVVADGLQIEVVMREPFLVALAEKHPLVKCGKINLFALANQTFVYSRRNCDAGFRAQVAAICRRGGFELRVARESHEDEAIFPMVASGLGISLVPASVRKLHLPGVVLSELADCPVQAEFAIAWQKENHSSVVQNFLKAVRGCIRCVDTATIKT